jgi:O-antigen ligase
MASEGAAHAPRLGAGEAYRPTGPVRLALSPVIIGVLAVVAGAALADRPLKVLFYRAAALGVLGIALRAAHPKRVLLFCWAATLTYNRNYFIGVFGDQGSYGLYWSPADFFLAALLGVWAYEAIVLKRAPVAHGRRLWPWFLPFAGACVLSILTAEHPEWTAFELTRVLRIALIFAYVRHNVRREEWWVCIAGIGCAILVQSALALTFVITGRKIGVTAVLGLSPGADQLQGTLQGIDADFGFRRGEGTFGHPNTMAVYFLLMGPMFYALALAARDVRIRRWASLVGLCALGGVACSMSRTSWVISAVQIVLMLTLLVGLGRLRARRVLGIAAVGAFAASLALAPFLPAIQRRFFGNFKESVDFRAKHDKIAIEIWGRSPVTGVGLNNYSKILSTYDLEDVQIFLKLADMTRNTLGIRATAWVHNIYLLMLAETGVIGLSGFLILIVGGLLIAVRAVATTGGDTQLVAAGLAVGMLGLHAHGLQESALWIDPITYSFALSVALATVAWPCAQAGAAVAVPRSRWLHVVGLRHTEWSLR